MTRKPTYEELEQRVKELEREATNHKQSEESLKKYREELKKMVEERTTEWKKTLIDLQNTQLQLMQSEKMASIGQLAAGVAHEINNPVGYVKSNLGTMHEYRRDLLNMLEQYTLLEEIVGEEKEICSNGAVKSALQKIQKTKKESDLKFIKEDFENVIEESIEGMQRVTKIVSDLKEFAHEGK